MKEKKEIISTVEEKELNAPNGLAVGILSVLVYIAAAVGVIPAAMALDNGSTAFGAVLMTICVLWLCVGWIPFMGVKVIRPNEALVLTLFGKYTGTLKKEGIFFVNPFSIAVNPASAQKIASGKNPQEATAPVGKKLSLKAMTLDNKKQKINDRDGNPIEISIVVIWKIANTAKAVFNVDNYEEYVSIQSDSALRDVAGAYPYDGDGENVKSLRGSSAEIAGHLRDMLQSRVDDAGIEVIEARITHLAYAPEIAAAMLQRQQAAAIIEDS